MSQIRAFQELMAEKGRIDDEVVAYYDAMEPNNKRFVAEKMANDMINMFNYVLRQGTFIPVKEVEDEQVEAVAEEMAGSFEGRVSLEDVLSVRPDGADNEPRTTEGDEGSAGDTGVEGASEGSAPEVPVVEEEAVESKPGNKRKSAPKRKAKK